MIKLFLNEDGNDPGTTELLITWRMSGQTVALGSPSRQTKKTKTNGEQEKKRLLLLLAHVHKNSLMFCKQLCRILL